MSFSEDLLLWTGGYVLLLLVLGGFGRRALRERTLTDFYLANRGIGFFVLLLTLFATQYSGNSMSGFPGQTYRQGLVYVMTVTFMVGIVSGYLLFAPRLFTLSRQRGYVTPCDFLTDRYASPWLHYLAALIFILSLFNFLLAQLMAMGHAFAGLTEGRIPFATAVVGGAAVILVYELLGGMRAVAWTDVLQGLLLMVGMLVIALLLVAEVGTPAAVIARIAAQAPEKLEVASGQVCASWLSNFLLLALGAPLYPQAIQRVYAARRLGDLKRALITMAWLPLIAVTTVVFVGAVGILLFPGLSGVEADQITFRVLRFLVQEQAHAYYPVLIVMLAVVAAIMSTADSCLLSISSILSKDLVARLRRLPPEEAERLSWSTPLSSGLVLALLVSLALLRPATLWGLLVIKFELLIQLSPAFVLGTLHSPEHPRAFNASDILRGLAVGALLALGLYATGHSQVYGFHAGTLGVAANYLTAAASRSWRCRQL